MSSVPTLIAITSATSALAAAASATMSWRSSRLSWIAIRETREQRYNDNARTSLAALAVVHHTVTVLIALYEEGEVGQTAWRTQLGDLERAIVASGISLPVCQKLADAAMPDNQTLVAAMEELRATALTIGAKITAVGPR